MGNKRDKRGENFRFSQEYLSDIGKKAIEKYKNTPEYLEKMIFRKRSLGVITAEEALRQAVEINKAIAAFGMFTEKKAGKVEAAGLPEDDSGGVVRKKIKTYRELGFVFSVDFAKRTGKEGAHVSVQVRKSTDSDPLKNFPVSLVKLWKNNEKEERLTDSEDGRAVFSLEDAELHKKTSAQDYNYTFEDFENDHSLIIDITNIEV